MRRLLFLLTVLFFLPQSTYAISADGFDYPVGKPDAQGFFDAQDFNEYNTNFSNYHLGEDWNKNCSGDCDLGDPIYSIADGVVISRRLMRGWGNVIMLEHEINGKKFKTLYGHFKDVYVTEGQKVPRGELIGTIGKGDPNYHFYAHLHFELREEPTLGIGSGYGAKDFPGYLNPHIFINSHRPVGPPKVVINSGVGGTTSITWPSVPEAEKYEIYRSETPGACGVGSPIKTITNTEETVFNDQGLTAGKAYYYCLVVYYKNGILSKSKEQPITIKQEVQKITNNTSAQTHPVISNGKIFWEDLRSENNTWPKKLYYYDLETKQQGFQYIGIDGAKRPYSPNAQGSRVVFYTNDSLGTGNNIYCHDFNTGSTYAITQARGDQVNPVISESGIVVWQDLRNGSNYDLYYLDVTKAQGESVFVAANGNQRNPAIWVNKVVWMDSRAGNRHDLYLKEIGGSEKLLATNVGDDTPSIWKNFVVWQYKGKVSMIDVDTGQTKVIAAANAGSSPRVRDNKVAYTLAEGSSSYIHIYDISTGNDTKIDFSLNYMAFPFVSGNILVFDHAEKATIPDMDIYLIYL